MGIDRPDWEDGGPTEAPAAAPPPSENGKIERPDWPIAEQESEPERSPYVDGTEMVAEVETAHMTPDPEAWPELGELDASVAREFDQGAGVEYGYAQAQQTAQRVLSAMPADDVAHFEYVLEHLPAEVHSAIRKALALAPGRGERGALAMMETIGAHLQDEAFAVVEERLSNLTPAQAKALLKGLGG